MLKKFPLAVFEIQAVKMKLKVFLAGHSAAMETALSHLKPPSCAGWSKSDLALRGNR